MVKRLERLNVSAKHDPVVPVKPAYSYTLLMGQIYHPICSIVHPHTFPFLSGKLQRRWPRSRAVIRLTSSGSRVGSCYNTIVNTGC